jgi:hypothetical protein
MKPFASTAASARTMPVYWDPALAIALSAFLLLQGWVMAFSIPRGVPPDELAHLSYVRDVVDGGLLPDYATGVIGSSSRGNYLNHPPLYYTLLGVYSRIVGLDPFDGYVVLRLLSAIFVAGGVLCWLLAARELGLGAPAAALATLALAALPMFGYLAGSVNNDTLAYGGTGLYFYGLARWLAHGQRGRMATAAILAGLCITLLTKATASAFVVLFTAIFLAMHARHLPVRLREDRTGAFLLAAALALCTSFYVYAYFQFGSLMPKPEVLHPIAPPAQPLSLFAYGEQYMAKMWRRLPAIVSQQSFDPFAPRWEAFLYLLLVAPLPAWLASRLFAASRGVDITLRRACDAFALAALGTMLLHFMQCYTGYRSTGMFGGLQPRYFFTVLPALWLLPLLLRPARWLRSAYLALACFAALFAFWSSAPFILLRQSEEQRAGFAARQPALPTPTASAVKLLGKGRGHVDILRITGDRLKVHGWAFNEPPLPVARVLVYGGETVIAALPVRSARPDVARATGSDAAARSGFAADVPRAGAFQECAIQVAAQASDGRVFWIRRESCAR